MSFQIPTMTVGDTAPSRTFVIKRSGAAVDLTGATVKFNISNPSGTVTNSGHATCTLVSASTGTVRYDFATGDLAVAGAHPCEVEITYSGGTIETIPQGVIPVVDQVA